jgi:hypothetical protein
LHAVASAKECAKNVQYCATFAQLFDNKFA